MPLESLLIKIANENQSTAIWQQSIYVILLIIN